jgi:hypothetical protein
MIETSIGVFAESKGIQMCTEANLSCTILAMSKAYITRYTKIFEIQKFPG